MRTSTLITNLLLAFGLFVAGTDGRYYKKKPITDNHDAYDYAENDYAAVERPSEFEPTLFDTVGTADPGVFRVGIIGANEEIVGARNGISRDRFIGSNGRVKRQGHHMGITGPVHTFQKTNKEAHFKWGVKHLVGHQFAG